MSPRYSGWYRRFSFFSKLRTSGYCSHCKSELSSSEVVDSRSAWCEKCTSVVEMSCFRVPGWVMGVVTLLAAGYIGDLFV